MKNLLIFLILCVPLFAQSTINEDTVHFVGQASAFTVGIEEVTDPGFPTLDNWTQGTWTLADGVVSEDNRGTNSDITQTLTGLTDGRMYRIQFEVTAYTDGLVTARFDNVELGDKNSTGVFTGYGVASGTEADLDIRADLTFTGSVDNVSVVAWAGSLDTGGGCTIATFTGTLTDYMTATGGVLASMIPGNCDADEAAGSLVRLTDPTTSPFADALVGQLIKIDFTDDNHADGTYEITTVTSSASVIVDLAYVGDETCYAWLGGAFPDIAAALNDTSVPGDASTMSEGPDGKYRNRYICVNVDQEVDAVTDFVAETSEPAHREDGGSRKIIGFYDSISVVQPDAGYRIVSDMDRGGIYYGGARKAFNSVEGFSVINPNGKWIEWNAKGNDINILELNTSNFEMRNIKIHNTIADSSAEGLFHIDTANFNTQLVNCWLATSSRFVVDDLIGKGNGVFDCYFEDTIDVMKLSDFRSSYFVGCIIDLGTKANGFESLDDCCITSCLVYGGEIGMNQMANSMLINNIFFNQTVSCVSLAASVHVTSVFINNIFSPAEAADNAINIANGSLGSGFNNIMYSVTAGAVLTNPIVHDQISPNPPLPVGTLEVDPLFVNPVDGDFRLRASSPALNGGMRTLFNGWTTIGANQPYSSTNAGYRSRYNFKGHNYSE